MSRSLEQKTEDDARPALSEEREGPREPLITCSGLLVWLPGHLATLAPYGDYHSNLQKVSCEE